MPPTTAAQAHAHRPAGLFTLTAGAALLLFALSVHSWKEQSHRSYARTYRQRMATDLARPEPPPPTERPPSAEFQLAPFLRHGLSAHLRDRDGHTTLMHAAAMRWPHLARYVLDQGVDPKALAQDGSEALTYAARSGDTEIARLLLIRGVPAGGLSPSRPSPLQAAVEQGHLEMVELLLRHRPCQGLDEALRAARERHGGLEQQVRWGRLLGGWWPTLRQRRTEAGRIVRLLSQRRAELAHQRGGTPPR